MLISQIQSPPHTANSIDAQVDEVNSDKSNNPSIFGWVAKVAYNVIAFIPRKSGVGIQLIYNKIKESTHAQKVKAIRARNTAYLKRAEAVFPFTKEIKTENDVLNRNHCLVNIELLQKTCDIKGKNFSSKVLGSTPEHMRKAIEEADKKAAVTDHAKRDFQLQKKYQKLSKELVELEDQKTHLSLETDVIIRKLQTVNLHENIDEVNELMTDLNANKAKMKNLVADIESKDKDLNDAFMAHEEHIGDKDIPLDVPATRRSPKPVTREDIKSGIEKSAKTLAGKEEPEDFVVLGWPSLYVAEAMDNLYKISIESIPLIQRAENRLDELRRNNQLIEL